MLDPLFQHMPVRLRAGYRFVVWKAERQGEKVKKVPYNARAFNESGRLYHASSTNGRSWSTFPQVVKAYQSGQFEGIGRMLLGDIVLIDIDHCRDEQGNLNLVAREVCLALGSFAEWSPSGNGLHIYVAGSMPADAANRYRYRDIEIEVYGTARFTTMTGHQLLGTPVEVVERQDVLQGLLQKWGSGNGGQQIRLMGRPVSALPGVPIIAESDLSRADQAVILRARAARNAQSFMELWAGGDPRGRGDKSKADMDLILLLLYWSNNDADQTERLYKASLRCDEKTERKTTATGRTYLQMSIYNAMQYRKQLVRA
jgi:putative DNA primase/helicase